MTRSFKAAARPARLALHFALACRTLAFTISPGRPALQRTDAAYSTPSVEESAAGRSACPAVGKICPRTIAGHSMASGHGSGTTRSPPGARGLVTGSRSDVPVPWRGSPSLTQGSRRTRPSVRPTHALAQSSRAEPCDRKSHLDCQCRKR